MGQNLVLQVFAEELAFGVVARVPVRGLGQVVRAIREELSRFGHLAGDEAGARHFHARPELVRDLHALRVEDRLDHALQTFTLEGHLVAGANQRHHDLRDRIQSLLLEPRGCVGNRLDLHLDDLREQDAQAAAAQTKHRVLLMQRLDGAQQTLLVLELRSALTFDSGFGDFDQHGFLLLGIALHRRDEVGNEVRPALIVGLEVAPFGVDLLLGGGDAVDPASCEAERGKRRKQPKSANEVHDAPSDTSRGAHR